MAAPDASAARDGAPMNQAHEQTTVCRLCRGTIGSTWTKKRDAPAIVMGEHPDKLVCAQQSLAALNVLADEIEARRRMHAAITANMPEIERLCLLQHPTLAVRPPAGMKVTPSGIVVPR